MNFQGGGDFRRCLPSVVILIYLSSLRSHIKKILDYRRSYENKMLLLDCEMPVQCAVTIALLILKSLGSHNVSLFPELHYILVTEEIWI